jgi:hypothetical protein
MPTLDEEIQSTLAAVDSCVTRLRSVHELRRAEHKSIAPSRVDAARRLRASLDLLIQELPADSSDVERILAELRQKSVL